MSDDLPVSATSTAIIRFNGVTYQRKKCQVGLPMLGPFNIETCRFSTKCKGCKKRYQMRYKDNLIFKWSRMDPPFLPNIMFLLWMQKAIGLSNEELLLQS